jgi:hypothetical protein
MKRIAQRSLAAAELLLVFPAALFMTALFVRSTQPQQYEPAHSAQRIVDWYAARPHVGLGVLMIALPLMVAVAGCTALLRRWRRDDELRAAAGEIVAHLKAHFATFAIFAATATAAGILAIVALHLITD